MDGQILPSQPRKARSHVKAKILALAMGEQEGLSFLELVPPHRRHPPLSVSAGTNIQIQGPLEIQPAPPLIVQPNPHHHADVAAPPSARRLSPYITLNTTSLAAPTTAPSAASTAAPLISLLTSSLVCTLTSTVLVLLI